MKELYKQLRLYWKIQGGRCFECARPVKPEEICKLEQSLNILCYDCYRDALIFFDEPGPIKEKVFYSIQPRRNDLKVVPWCALFDREIDNYLLNIKKPACSENGCYYCTQMYQKKITLEGRSRVITCK